MQRFSRLAACLAVFSALTVITHAGPVTWTDASGVNDNWSTAANWSPGTAPTNTDTTLFLNTGAGGQSVLDSTRTIGTMIFGQDNGATHTLNLNSGQTLFVNGLAGSNDAIYVGTALPIALDTVVNVLVQGTGALVVSNTAGSITVRQAHANSGGHRATLDMSGLDTFTAWLSRIQVGQGTGGNFNRTMGTLILARTNRITLSGADPQINLADNSSNNNGNSAVSFFTLGEDTILNVNSMRIGGQKQVGNMSFSGTFSTPSLTIRGTNGGSTAASLIVLGDNSPQGTSANPSTGIMNLDTGTADIVADTMILGRGQNGVAAAAGTATGTLTVGSGPVTVNTLEIAFQMTNTTVATVTGTLNVNNNGLFSTGAVLRVNNTLRLARSAGASAAINGTLNINANGTVIANSIVSGGGNSTISMQGNSILILSNTAGSIASPVRNFDITDVNLTLPALNGASTIAVSNFTTSGSANTINVSAIPAISSYPATFTMISYQNVTYLSGPNGNFVLGSLPAASPAYQGEILDLGAGVVSLRLTNGPISVNALRWTGAADANWNSSSINWSNINLNIPTNFSAGAEVLFNDRSSVSNVLLTESLSPGTVTVSNNTVSYTFGGTGQIASATTLLKRGSSSLILANSGVNNVGVLRVDNGTVQLGNGGTSGAVSALSITNNGTLVVDHRDSLTLSSPIDGTGSVVKNGAGTLTLAGANTYSGATLLNQGTLLVNGTVNGALSSSVGTTLAGSGPVNGLTSVAGELNPGPVAGVGHFAPNGGLTLASGATLTFDLSAASYSDPAQNDEIEVLGNVIANNNTIHVNISGTALQSAQYLLMAYSGTLSGTFNPVVTGTHFATSLDTSIPGFIYLNITGVAGASLKWNSTSNTAWDVATTNWLNLGSSSPDKFLNGDSVLLDDTVGVTNTLTLASGVIVTPAVISNTANLNNFTINGAGRISGSGNLVKQGSNTLTISSANDFSGTVEVFQGTLRTGNGSALGTNNPGTIVHDGATLDLNGQNLGGEPINVVGDGVGGLGAIVNNGGTQNQALRQIVLAGNVTFGGTGRWDMNNGGGGSALTTGASPYKITKVGTNQVSFSNTSIDAQLGDIDIREGSLNFSGNTATMGNSTSNLNVRAGATLQFGNNSGTFNKQFHLVGNGTAATVQVDAGGSVNLIGPVDITNDCRIVVNGPSLTISNTISGPGGLTKAGASPLTLWFDNPYTGATVVNAGTLLLNVNGAISASTNITVAANATLNVAGRTDGALNLTSSQTLKGNGTVAGTLSTVAGSKVAPGVDAIGALTVTGAVALAGTTIMELDSPNSTNDVLRSSSDGITYGGTLNLVNLAGPLTGGTQFKLFSASGYSGTFAGVVPATPGPGQTWDLSTLTNGVVKVVGSPPVSAPPTIAKAVISGTNIILSGTNNSGPGGTYAVLTSTNVSVRLTNWSVLTSGTFDGSGKFSSTNPVGAGAQRFYILKVP